MKVATACVCRGAIRQTPSEKCSTLKGEVVTGEVIFILVLLGRLLQTRGKIVEKYQMTTMKKPSQHLSREASLKHS